MVAMEGFLGPLEIYQRSLEELRFYIVVASWEASTPSISVISHNRGKGVSEQERALSMGSRYLGHLLEIPAERTASVSPEKALAWV